MYSAENWHGGWGVMGFIPFGLLIVVVLAILLIRGGPSWGAGRDRESRRESALEILDRRYASGEITKPQYEEMKRDLNS